MSAGRVHVKRTAGLAAGVVVCLIIWNLPLQGLAPDGRKCLALSLMAVIWWATGAMHPGFSSLALLLGYSLLLDPAVAPRSLIFSLWTSPTIYLVIGGFLIAAAVKDSGLGQRISLNYVKRFVRSYRGIIISCYLLGFLLSFVIPHPWPRSFLLMSVMDHVIRAASLEKRYAANIRLAVFAGSIPTAMILLTGDSTLNPAVSGFADTSVSWLQWALYMGLPGLLASLLTCGSQLMLFKGPSFFYMEGESINGRLAELGKVTPLEKKTALAILLAVLLWGTDSLHGLHPGWVALGIAIFLSMPLMDALNASSWSQVNPGTLFFLSAALAIGTVGGATGMNEWVARLLMPSQASANPYVFALIAMGVCMVLHMVLGSTLAVLGIASPAIVSFGVSAGLPPLAAALIAYTSVTLHWLLPFHHMNLLVGIGDRDGYGEKEVLTLGIPQVLVVAAVVLFEVFWWGVIGLI